MLTIEWPSNRTLSTLLQLMKLVIKRCSTEELVNIGGHVIHLFLPLVLHSPENQNLFDSCSKLKYIWIVIEFSTTLLAWKKKFHVILWELYDNTYLNRFAFCLIILLQLSLWTKLYKQKPEWMFDLDESIIADCLHLLMSVNIYKKFHQHFYVELN